jgi:hypothetical protein
MKLLSIKPMEDGKHKYQATFEKPDGTTKKTSFGAKGYTDFILSKDETKRDLYKARHAKDLKTDDPTRAGYLSMFILWNKPTLKASIADYKKRFNL